MENPRDKYPRPPFRKQQQPFPALTNRMVPIPDHGEDTYVGSGRLHGRRALITGGDSGIGRAAAIAYAREGADVAINYLPEEEEDAQEVVRLIELVGRRAFSIPGDITSEAFCQQLVQKAVKKMGGLDILVNNAAFQKSYPTILDIPAESFDRTMKTNVYAPFWITKAAVPYMEAGSAIIVTASVQAYDPEEVLLDYAQTKATNVILVKALAKQLGKKGIRVNGVAPGPIWTPLQVCSKDPEMIANFGASTAWGRAGQPAELASIYVQLADNSGSYSTGQIFGASGGGGHP
ncbi:SDR family oxidoreductase [Sphingobacterium suaedae]